MVPEGLFKSFDTFLSFLQDPWDLQLWQIVDPVYEKFSNSVYHVIVDRNFGLI